MVSVRPNPINFAEIHQHLSNLTRLQKRAAIIHCEMLAAIWTAPPTAKVGQMLENELATSILLVMALLVAISGALAP
jgi:hypothetical protein